MADEINVTNFHESDQSNPNAAPSLGAIARFLEDHWPHVINPIIRTAVVDQGTDDGTVTLAFNGQCDGGDSAQYGFAFSFGTSELLDSYGFGIPGGPNDAQIDNVNDHPIYTQALARGSYFNTFFRIDGKRKLPWQTDSEAGFGICLDDYGNYDAKDPQHPGTTVTAPGIKDIIVTKPRYNIFPRAQDTLPAAGEGAQTTDTEPGYDHPVYGTSAIGFDPDTKAAFVKYNPDDLKLDDQDRLALSDAVKAELGGGGGGSTGPGAANYGISTDQFQGDGDLGLTVAWDHIISGDNKYLDPANTDGLTIPPDGGGDYDLETTLVVHTGVAPSTQPWVLAYDLYIQLWRAGAMLWQQGRHDQYTQDPTDTPPWNFPQVSTAAAVPATQAGDVIKVFWLGHITGHDGTAYTGSSIDNFVDDLTWVSIIPSGHGAAEQPEVAAYLGTFEGTLPTDGSDMTLEWDHERSNTMPSGTHDPTGVATPASQFIATVDGKYELVVQLDASMNVDEANWVRLTAQVNGATARRVITETFAAETGDLASLPLLDSNRSVKPLIVELGMFAGDYVEALMAGQNMTTPGDDTHAAFIGGDYRTSLCTFKRIA